MIGTRGFTHSHSLGPVHENVLEGIGLRHCSNEVRRTTRKSAFTDVKHAFHYGLDSVQRKYSHPEWDGEIQLKYDNEKQKVYLNINGLVVRLDFVISSEPW